MRICLLPICTKELTGKQKKFCSKKCTNIHNSRNEMATRSSTITGDTCKWCMDSEEGFCCEKHKQMYENLRKAIDSELARRKPKPTEAQLKFYKKLQGILTNTVVNR